MDIIDAVAPAYKKASSNFYNKVFSLFGLSILITGLGVYIGFHYLLNAFVTAPLLMYLFFAFELLLIFTSRAWSKKEPLNYFLFSLFTLSSGITIVPLIAVFAAEFGGYDIIYRALFSTTAMFLAMGFIGYSIKKPLTGLTGFLFMGLIGIIVVSVLGIFFPWGNTGEIIFSGFGVLLFAAFAIVDINRLAYYHEDEYINAAIRLYLDIFNLFIFVLRLTGALARD